jgi:hypothetical protein
LIASSSACCAWYASPAAIQLLVAVAVLTGAGLADLVGDGALERGRRLGPVLHLHEGLRRVAVELAAHVALAGQQVAVRFLVHLGRDAHAAALAVAVGGLLVLVLRGVERAGGVELAGLDVQLGGLGEAVLVAADLGRLPDVARLEVVADRGVGQAALAAQLGRLRDLALAGERGGALLELASRALRRRHQRRAHRPGASLVDALLLPREACARLAVAAGREADPEQRRARRRGDPRGNGGLQGFEVSCSAQPVQQDTRPGLERLVQAEARREGRGKAEGSEQEGRDGSGDGDQSNDHGAARGVGAAGAPHRPAYRQTGRPI